MFGHWYQVIHYQLLTLRQRTLRRVWVTQNSKVCGTQAQPWLDWAPLAIPVTFELPQAQAETLHQAGERLGISPQDLARAAIADLLATPDESFRAAAERVLCKNEALYRRLA